ncbi:MAG: iron-containing alcohol dehydrogenase [Lachnospiraceae bacterium]|nr:iron-containing alcohol dehydrogenase [Lachnospiraceae bacterium]
MKALILNSGMGTRMGILTSEQPKCMTEVYGTTTILERQLKQLLESGITDVVITTGAHDEVLREYVSSLNLPLSVTYVFNEQFRETNYIYSIYRAREYLNDDIILMHGDLVFENEVLDEVLNFEGSCMTVSSTLPLPQKDFKAVIEDEHIIKVGIEFFDSALAAQPLYKLDKHDWEVWLNSIIDYCENGEEAKRKCYAENAFNEVSDRCLIHPLDVRDMLCNEIDTPEDLQVVSGILRRIEQRTVYVSFSTDIIHSGHMALIKKARRLGRLIIGVISDDVVASYKRYPLLPYEERKVLFENIVGVSQVVEQKTLSYKDNIERYRPTYVVHGDDWKEGFQKPIRDEVVELLAGYGGRLIEFSYASDPKYARLEKRAGISQKMSYVENNYMLIDEYLIDNHVKRLLLVCGKAVEYHPLFSHICTLEDRTGIKVVRFSDFTPNPKYESVRAGVDLFLDENCDSILAIGGGSTMDVAKCIKLFASMDHDRNYLEQRIDENNILLMAVPTTAGTGSEVTRYAVIYYNGIKQSITHESCIPSMVFVDPSFLKTVADYHRKATLFDALCHGIESYWSVNSTDESKSYAREAIGMILDNMDDYLANDNHGNIAMQRASQLAGRAINITQTTAGHAMCYMLTSMFGIAHGHAAALCVNELWPYMIEHTDDCIDKRGEKYLVTTLRELATAFDRDTPQEAASEFDKILDQTGFMDITDKTSATYAGKDSVIDELVSTVKPERLGNHPVKLETEILKRMYKAILDRIGL